MRRFPLLAMLTRNDGNHRQPALLGSPCHFDYYGPDAASGDYDHYVIRTKAETLQNLFRIAFVVLQIKRGAKTIIPDDSRVVREREFHHRNEAHKSTLAG